MYITDADVKQVPFIVGTGGIVAGDLAVVSSATAVKAAAAASDATVLGIALADGSAGDTISFGLVAGKTVASGYTGSTKTSVVAADTGKVFDLTDENTVNLDDTTVGICVCTGYNNTTKEIKFMIPRAKLYI